MGRADTVGLYNLMWQLLLGRRNVFCRSNLLISSVIINKYPELIINENLWREAATISLTIVTH